MDEKEKIKEMLKKNKKKVSVATLVGTVVVAIVVGVGIGYALLSLFFKGPSIPTGPQVNIPPPPPSAKVQNKPKPPKKIEVKTPVSSLAVSVPKPAVTAKLSKGKTLPQVVNTYASGVASGKKIVFKPSVKPAQKPAEHKVARKKIKKKTNVGIAEKKQGRHRVVEKKRVQHREIVSSKARKCSTKKRIQEAMKISPTAKRRYVIQVASDRNKKIAIYTLGRLIRCGYKSYLRDVVVHGKRYTRVMVGPVSSYSKARFIASQVKKALHLSYNPLIIGER